MQAIGILLLIILAIIVYIAILYLLFWVAAVLFPIGCIAFIGLVLFNYVKVVYDELVIGNGWIDSPTGPEPAFKQYFFRKAYHDYWQVVEKSGRKNFDVLVWVKDKGIMLFANSLIWITFPLALGYIAVVAGSTIAGFLAYVVFGLVHLAIVVIYAAIAITAAYSLRLFEYLLMAWRRTSLKCPHGDCHGDISLPYYLCPGPSCGANHENLLPGSYGVVRRQCQCGAWLPTLFLFGRNQLPGFCPDCKKPLNSSLGVIRNLHIPIVGGPSAGKTNFLMASMMEIQKSAKNGKASLAFPETKYEKLYEAGSRNFKSGAIAGKTVEESPDAFLFNVNTGGADRLLYIYDAAGELFNQTDKMRRQEYYNYVDGIVFLIDPFSLPQVQSTLERELSNAKINEQIKPCKERPQDVYSKLLQTVQQEKGIGRNSISKPIAVVVTKSDAFDVSTQIQRFKTNQPPLEKNIKQTPDSLAVRTWLERNGEGNLVRGIERDFKDVSYFYCSPLGRTPDSSTAPFSPKGVLNPFNWMLNGYGLDFENGTSSKPINPNTTATASTFVPNVTPPGETLNGKVIAGLWAASVVFLIVGSVLFFLTATAGYAYFSSSGTNYVASNTVNTPYNRPANTNSPSLNSKNSSTNSNSKSFRSNTSVRVYSASLKRSDGSVIENLSEDTPLKVIEKKKQWYWVETEYGTVGWIHGNDIYPLQK